jgi:Concanavalin A-like lectin/glucanases superfamily
MHRHLRTLLTSDRHPDAGWGDGPDPHWGKVGLLLRCEGVDGGTSFADSSAFAHSVSRFGATTSTAQAKWGASSGLIATAGNTNRLEVAHNESLSAPTGDFSIEAWVKFTSVAAVCVIFNKAAGSGVYPYQLTLLSGALVFRGFNNSSSQVFSLASKTLPQVGIWYFLQGVRRAGVVELRVNGVVEAAADIGVATVLFENASHVVSVGGLQGGAGSVPVIGYVDDVRFTKGVARPPGLPRGPFTVG